MAEDYSNYDTNRNCHSVKVLRPSIRKINPHLNYDYSNGVYSVNNKSNNTSYYSPSRNINRINNDSFISQITPNTVISQKLKGAPMNYSTFNSTKVSPKRETQISYEINNDSLIRRNSPIRSMNNILNISRNKYITPNPSEIIINNEEESKYINKRNPPNCVFERSKTYSSNRTDISEVYPIKKRKNDLNFKKPCNCVFNNPLTEKNICFCNEHIRIKNIFNFLKDIVEKDSKIEKIKEELAFCSDANLNDLFAFFDVSQSDSISMVDLSDSLKEIGIYLPTFDLKLIIERFDKDLDGRLK
ncbi:MAG: hypothetical protein MJ252_05890 [archaeon]|nr:hypothetical protein [archaeon]